MKTTRGAHGVLQLLTEFDEVRQVRRVVRLEATPDGGLLLTDTDPGRPGRARRFAITPAELVAAIRRHGVAPRPTNA